MLFILTLIKYSHILACYFLNISNYKITNIIRKYLNFYFYLGKSNFSIIFSATRIPSTAAEIIPPANPAPSPVG